MYVLILILILFQQILSVVTIVIPDIQVVLILLTTLTFQYQIVQSSSIHLVRMSMVLGLRALIDLLMTTVKPPLVQNMNAMLTIDNVSYLFILYQFINKAKEITKQ